MLEEIWHNLCSECEKDMFGWTSCSGLLFSSQILSCFWSPWKLHRIILLLGKGSFQCGTQSYYGHNKAVFLTWIIQQKLLYKMLFITEIYTYKQNSTHKWSQHWEFWSVSLSVYSSSTRAICQWLQFIRLIFPFQLIKKHHNREFNSNVV